MSVFRPMMTVSVSVMLKIHERQVAFVCWRDNLKNYEQISMRIFGVIVGGTWYNCLHFGGDPHHHHLDSDIFEWIH